VPGVYRPYTLVDVLGALNQQNTQQTGGVVTAIGVFAETNEGMTSHDTMTAVVQVGPNWDSGEWGSFSWS
jgi:hypothetical protein